MGKILTTIIIALFCMANEDIKPGNYIDFLYWGKTYPIVEQNILEMMKEAFKDANITKERVQSELRAAIDKAATFHTALPLCIKSEHLPIRQDIVVLPNDIINPLGRVVYKKGMKIVAKLPKGQSLDLCFVKGSLPEVKKEISIFRKKYPNCVYMVADVDVRAVWKAYPDMASRIFPSKMEAEKRFDVQCYPAALHMEEDIIEEERISAQKILNQ